MKRSKWTFIVSLSLLLTQAALYSAPIGIAKKAIEETIEFAARKSGVVLAPATRKTAENALKAAIIKYGDDALFVVRKGGLETLQQGAKYGDDFWKICMKGSPDAVRSLTLHADELFPIVKRCGKDFLILEGKVPGLGARTVELFGDASIKTFKNAPPSHITQMVGFANKANSPKNVELLYDGYVKSGGKILDHLNWKHIMAGGLSSAAIIAAYKATGAIETLAENNPELLADALSNSFTTIGMILLLITFLALAVVAFKFKWLAKLFPKQEMKEDKSAGIQENS